MTATLKRISKELKTHAPFTMLGAAMGIAIVWVIIYAHVPRSTSETLFWVFHPSHVYLSALVTAAMCGLHGERRFWTMLWVGYIGSVGIATASDCVIPYLAEWLLALPNKGFHLGFIEMWWLVNPLALAGICTAYVRPTTKLPHAAHVFLSTGASLFHITMALGKTLDVFAFCLITVFLFLAVWIPCCTSDIVFPLIFAKKEREEKTCGQNGPGRLCS